MVFGPDAYADPKAAPAATLGGLRIFVLADMAPLASFWQQFQEDAITTYYQSHDWCSAWMDVMPAEVPVEPVLVLGLRLDGTAAFLLPLQKRIKHGIAAIEFMTAPQAGYGFGIFDKEFSSSGHEWFANHFAKLEKCLPEHDVIYLRELPESISGHSNPMRSLFNIRSANQSYIMTLEPDFDALLERKRSAETRRSFRKRDARLMAMGNIQFGQVPAGEVTSSTLNQMFHDQRARLAEAGVHEVYTPLERRFIHRLADMGARNDIDKGWKVYRLTNDERLVCATAGGMFQKTYFAVVISLADGPERKHSPGDFVLRNLIGDLCSKGFTAFDFSAGDFTYKNHWTDHAINLHHCIRGRGAKGRCIAWLLRRAHDLKRLLKRNDRIRTLLLAVRKQIFGKKVTSGQR